MLKIVSAPHSVLSTPAKPVEKIDENIKKLVADMEETLDAQVDPQGVGLAAPQVGISLRLFIVKPRENSKPMTFINPKILRTSGEQSMTKQKRTRNKLEGCLSIPKIWSPVRRPKNVHLEYETLEGEKKKGTFKGLMAIILQHEVDHLEGILFTQRALEQKTPLYEEKDGEFERMA